MRGQGMSEVAGRAIESAGGLIHPERADAGVVAIDKEQRSRVLLRDGAQVRDALGREMKRGAGVPEHLNRAAEATISSNQALPLGQGVPVVLRLVGADEDLGSRGRSGWPRWRRIAAPPGSDHPNHER